MQKLLDFFAHAFPASNFTLLAAILGLPLIGAFVNGVFGKRLGKEAVTLMALFAVGGSFVLSVISFLLLRDVQIHTEEGEQAARFVWQAWHWLDLSFTGEAAQFRTGGTPGQMTVDVAFSLDALNATMSLIVTGVGFLIHLYSTKYMADDPGYHRFFAYLNLFIFAMLVLILGDSLPILFVGWEGVGLCSYLLIGFWFQEKKNASAGTKAFIVNRIGDFGLLVAMALLVKYTGALSWSGIQEGAMGLSAPAKYWHLQPVGPDAIARPMAWLIDHIRLWVPSLAPAIIGPHSTTNATLVALALFLGCAGKSAQIPLYTWLPDAMAGPTPVSALIHAATMVTAGVYLVCRMAPIFVLSPEAMFTVATVGAITAVFAATIALVQNDIKKVLAYSTVSQLGYMFLGVGVGAFSAGFFHVVTHAFFKACLFLGAGSVIHAMHARIHDGDASQDIRNMGGLKDRLPWTHITFLVSCLAIAGFPMTSGFFSKDEILAMAYTSRVGSASPEEGVFVWPSWAPTMLLTLGAVGAVMTAFYMFRLYFLTFHGSFRGWTIVQAWQPEAAGVHGHDAHGHDAHGHGHAPPAGRHLEGPEPQESPLEMTVPLMILGTLAFFGGFLNFDKFGKAFDRWLEPVFASAASGVRVEEHAAFITPIAIVACVLGIGLAYWMYIVQAGAPAKQLAERLPIVHQLLMEKWQVDELYDELVVGTVDFMADVCVWIDRWVVDGIVARLTSWVVAASGHLLRLFQTGRVQAYATAVVVGLTGVGWFLTAPHASAVKLGSASTGDYTILAAPGLGYGYRWDADGDGKMDDAEFGDRTSVAVKVEPGQSRSVRLEVRNAFGRIAERTFTIERPLRDASGDGTNIAVERGPDGKLVGRRVGGSAPGGGGTQ